MSTVGPRRLLAAGAVTLAALFPLAACEDPAGEGEQPQTEQPEDGMGEEGRDGGDGEMEEDMDGGGMDDEDGEEEN